MMKKGVTIAIYGDSGSGKSTQLGEMAKALFKRERKRTRIYGSDLGGHESITPLVDLGVIEAVDVVQADDPWCWLDAAVKPTLSDDIGLVCYDSGTSCGEAILNAIAKSTDKIGQQTTQKFKAGSGATKLTIGLNNEAHYGLVQTFLLDKMWESSWITASGRDVAWTFGTHRGESSDSEPLVGPKLPGKALTAAIPKWFNYTFRLVAIPVADSAPRHVLYLQGQPGHTGLAVSFGNARYALDASTPLPASIEPASVVKALELIESGRQEAVVNLRAELGL